MVRAGLCRLLGQLYTVLSGLCDSMRLEAGSSCTVHGLFPGSVRVTYWAHAIPGLEAGLSCIRVQGAWHYEVHFVSLIQAIRCSLLPIPYCVCGESC